ncbi:hypothetical protein ABB37_00329 [Leptomonas pyrrhocoris]|uniref:Transmembrane protein n=1 Tax=Leptomonas pyrrhocoris TaxID=157538 RepID=A0A0N0VHT0_LEPPY|nr:hypothetical protein ABB37_00329 [Leptomonas pyrrhocoris]KPA86061.1 hypothetical protein ABB37_00329 [Leptomonas pyrrhocoris]|eukprot:XP_015664500.1 hypothetical protein ABB37_00329 [Leptomonas pyrrhocoris]
MSNTSNSSRQPVDYSNAQIEYGAAVSNVSSVAKGEEDQAQQLPTTAVAAHDSDNQRRLAKLWKRREQYRVASLVLVVVALVTALASIAIVVVVFNDCNHFHYPGSDSQALYVLVSFLLYIVVLVESVLSVIATIVLLVCLCRRPESVLLRAPFDHGKFVCLCIFLVLWLLFAGYSFAVPIILEALEQYPKEPVALCVVPGVRVVALLALVCVVGANRTLRRCVCPLLRCALVRPCNECLMAAFSVFTRFVTAPDHLTPFYLCSDNKRWKEAVRQSTLYCCFLAL